MNSINEIFELPTWDERIKFIRNARRTPMPDVKRLAANWFTDQHRIHDKQFRKDMKTLVKEEYYDAKGVLHPAEFETEPVARIALPIEQDVVNIHTAFTVGNEPKISADTEDVREQDVLRVVRKICADNKLKFQNKRELRAWLSEQEVCEYWYRYSAGGFWHRVWAKVASLAGISVKPQEKLRVQVWSPFRGDRLYPIFSDNGNDYLGIGREYEYRKDDQTKVQCFMLVTGEEVHQIQRGGSGAWEYTPGYPFRHGFAKNPTVYAYRPEELCHNISGARESLETLTSDWSDAIKMNFFPKLILEGDLAAGGAENIGKSHLLKITGGGKAYYLNWTQTSDMVKSQCDNLLSRCYSFTNTPLISFDQIKGTGQPPSGTAFDFMFMATLFACARHWEDMGEFYQRRVNFLVSAVGSLVPSLRGASEMLEVTVEQRPYRIEDLAKRVSDAVNAVDGGVMSRKQGVLLVGITDDYQSEIEEIEADERRKQEMEDIFNAAE